MFALIVLAFSLPAGAIADVLVARSYIYKAVTGGVGNQVIGVIDFTQSGNTVTLNGSLSGLGEPQSQHGFHVHDTGDIGNGCIAAGGHFNPEHKDHGAPTDADRHVGDLGNIQTAPNGDTPIYITDSVISLNGGHSIIGRSVVVHQLIDDLGKGNSPDSKTTGNSGARIACGVIGIVTSNTNVSAAAASLLAVILTFLFNMD